MQSWPLKTGTTEKIAFYEFPCVCCCVSKFVLKTAQVIGRDSLSNELHDRPWVRSPVEISQSLVRGLSSCEYLTIGPGVEW